MSRRNLPVGKALTEDSKAPSIYWRRARAAFFVRPGVPPPLRGDQPKIPSPACGLQNSIPRRAPMVWKGQQDGEGTFGLVGSPKENGWEVAPQASIASRKVLEVQGGRSPLVGVRGQRPRGKGWAKTDIRLGPGGRPTLQCAFHWRFPQKILTSVLRCLLPFGSIVSFSLEMPPHRKQQK